MHPLVSAVLFMTAATYSSDSVYQQPLCARSAVLRGDPISMQQQVSSGSVVLQLLGAPISGIPKHSVDRDIRMHAFGSPHHAR